VAERQPSAADLRHPIDFDEVTIWVEQPIDPITWVEGQLVETLRDHPALAGLLADDAEISFVWRA
jgi:hypothetical protein